MSRPLERMGYRVWVKADGTPGIEPSDRPETSIPLTIVNSRTLMRQKNEDGTGKYYQDRQIAFEDANAKWLLLYESKPLKLMNTGHEYLSFWQEETVFVGSDEDFDSDEEFSGSAAIKNASYILEMSVPVHTRGRIRLESMCRTIRKNMRRGRFVIIPPKDERRLFNTDSVQCDDALYPLFRQCSVEQRKSQDFRVCCRPSVLQHHPDAELVFIVYPKTVQLQLDDTIDDETCSRLLGMESVLVFKQIKSEKK